MVHSTNDEVLDLLVSELPTAIYFYRHLGADCCYDKFREVQCSDLLFVIAQ